MFKYIPPNGDKSHRGIVMAHTHAKKLLLYMDIPSPKGHREIGIAELKSKLTEVRLFGSDHLKTCANRLWKYMVNSKVVDDGSMKYGLSYYTEAEEVRYRNTEE